mgnify:CR=1 FL=1
MPLITQNMKTTFEANIFVKFVPTETSEDEFKEKMGEAGKVISVKLKDYN